MGLFNFLFGKPTPPPPVIKPEPPKPKPKPVFVETRTEAEIAIDGFQAKIDNATSAIETARETLYDQKAQLRAKKAARDLLGEEIDNHKHSLLLEEERYADADPADVEDIEINAQKIQNIIMRKQERYDSQSQTLRSLEGIIDVLEGDVTANDIDLSKKQSDLESIRTASAVLTLNKEIRKNLPLQSFNVDAEQLEVFRERQNLELEDISAESIGVSYSHKNALALPFKERMKKAKEAAEPELMEREAS